MPRYECMLLVDPAVAAKEWNKVEEEIGKTFEKHGAKVLALNKWGDRRLAYKIKGMSRATYVLVFFEGPTGAPKNLRADFLLSEPVMRTLILTHPGEIQKTETEPPPPPAPAPTRAPAGRT